MADIIYFGNRISKYAKNHESCGFLIAIMLTKNKNPESHIKSSPLKKAVHKLQIAFLSHSALEKYYACCLALPFIATILSKMSNDIANSNKR